MTPLVFSCVVTLASHAAGLVGVGGGIMTVPRLTLRFGVDVRHPIAASVISVIPTSSGSASAYLIGSQESGSIPLPHRPNSNGGTNIILPPNAAARAMRNIDGLSPGSFGNWRPQGGISTMPRSSVAQFPSTTPIMSGSSSTITAGGSAWRRASDNTTSLKSASPAPRRSRCPPLRLKEMPMAHPTRIAVRMRKTSAASTRIASSVEALGTTCHRKRHRLLPKPSWTWIAFDQTRPDLVVSAKALIRALALAFRARDSKPKPARPEPARCK